MPDRAHVESDDPTIEAVAPEPRDPRPWYRRNAVVRTLIADPWTLLGALIVVAFLLMAILAPWIAPSDPERGSILARLQPPSAEHWLGTDGLELICPAQAGPIAAGAVAKYRHKYNITPAGMDALLAAIANAGTPF